ncbi:hypothetical protein ACB098_07G021100 [Castanea mollissima]
MEKHTLPLLGSTQREEGSKREITVIMACTVEEDREVVMDLEQMDEQETPGISLHAISGDKCTQDKEGENVQSGAGRRKGAICATNQELPRQIHIDASVHSITQDCCSNKTKITKHVPFKRSLYLEKTESGANASSPLSLTNGAAAASI